MIALEIYIFLRNNEIFTCILMVIFFFHQFCYLFLIFADSAHLKLSLW